MGVRLPHECQIHRLLHKRDGTEITGHARNLMWFKGDRKEFVRFIKEGLRRG